MGREINVGAEDRLELRDAATTRKCLVGGQGEVGRPAAPNAHRTIRCPAGMNKSSGG